MRLDKNLACHLELYCAAPKRAARHIFCLQVREQRVAQFASQEVDRPHEQSAKHGVELICALRCLRAHIRWPNRQTAQRNRESARGSLYLPVPRHGTRPGLMERDRHPVCFHSQPFRTQVLTLFSWNRSKCSLPGR